MKTVNCDAIVLWKKKRKYHSIYACMTKQRGIIHFSLPHKQSQSMKLSNYLQPFSKVHLTLKEEGDGYGLLQLDGDYIGSFDNLDHIMYAAVAGDMITSFCAPHKVNLPLYHKVEGFASVIRTKPIRFAMIILGWQLLEEEGFIPMKGHLQQGKGLEELREEFVTTLEWTLTDEMIQSLLVLLSYAWDMNRELSLPKSQWDVWERLLFDFMEAQSERKLESLAFLRAHT